MPVLSRLLQRWRVRMSASRWRGWRRAPRGGREAGDFFQIRDRPRARPEARRRAPRFLGFHGGCQCRVRAHCVGLWGRGLGSRRRWGWVSCLPLSRVKGDHIVHAVRTRTVSVLCPELPADDAPARTLDADDLAKCRRMPALVAVLTPPPPVRPPNDLLALAKRDCWLRGRLRHGSCGLIERCCVACHTGPRCVGCARGPLR